MKPSKKGFVVTGLVSLLVYLGFILIIILFFFIFKLGIGDTVVKTKGIASDTDSEYVFLNYLRTPITVNIDGEEETLNYAELIAKYYLNQGTPKSGDFQKLLREKTEEFFGGEYPHLAWKLIVSDKMFGTPDAAKVVASGQTTSKLTKDKTLVDKLSIICTTIPNPILGEPIKVEMVFFNLGANAFEREKYQSLKSGKFHC